MALPASGAVSLNLTLNGEDKASGVIKGASGEMAKFDAVTQRARETTTRSGAAFSGLAAVLGGESVPVIQKAGQAMTAAGAAANIVPGPIGMMTAAMAAAAVGAYELAKYMGQAEASVRLLGTAQSSGLADRLGIDTDGALRLGQALAEARRSGAEPMASQLNMVVDNARAIGQDPTEAALKFVAAWKAGPDAVLAMQSEIGNLGIQSRTLKDVLGTVKLRPEDVGLDKDIDALQQLKDGTDDLTRRLQRLDQARASYDAARAARDRNPYFDEEAVNRVRAAKQELDIANAAVEARQRSVQAVAAEVKQVRGIAELEQYRQNMGALLDARAGMAASKEAKAQLQITSILEQRKLLEREIAAVEAARVALGDKEADSKLIALKLERERSYASEKAIKDGQKQLAIAQADAAGEAGMRLLRAKADSRKGLADELVAQEALIDREAAIATAAARRAEMTARQRSATLAAIEQERRNKHLDAERAAAEENQRIIEQVNARDQQIVQARADAADAAAKARSATMSARLREAGDEFGAILAEQRQAEADYNAALLRIEQERLALIGDGNISVQRQADIEAAAADKRVAALEALQLAELNLQKQRDQAVAQDVQKFGAASQYLAQASQMVGGTVGRSMQNASSAIGKVAGSWKSLKESAPDAISAAGSVAAGFVAGEKEKAAIMAITEAAAAAASFASYNIPAGIGHSAAAALYASVATGVIPSGGQQSAPAGGGAPAAQQSGGAPVFGSGSGGGESGGPITHNIFLGVLGTEQQAAALMAKNQSTLKKTGLTQVYAKGV